MKIGYAVCGSFCTIGKSLTVLEEMAAAGDTFIPIMSENAYTFDTRFGKAEDVRKRLLSASRWPGEIVHTIAEAERFGPEIQLDALIIAPCTGNTLAKAALGITDTPVTMAIKAQLRRDGLVVLALATNDALSSNLKNICVMLNHKNVFFVPLRQDDPVNKPYSTVADFRLLPDTLKAAREGRQIQPVLL